MRQTVIYVTFLFLLFVKDVVGQKHLNRDLFFFQDSINVVGCGTMTYASVFVFVSDTNYLLSDKNLHYIIIECPELYGKDFFKRGVRYNLSLTKEYKKMSGYFSKNIFSFWRKKKNLYMCEKITVAELRLGSCL